MTGENAMKRIIFTLCIFFALATCGVAGELYTCTGPDGNSIVTDTPQDGMKNCSALKYTSKSGTLPAAGASAAKSTSSGANAGANSGGKVSGFYNNCTQACNKSGKCESKMSDGDLKDCLQYCGTLNEMFKVNATIIDNPIFQNSFKGFECLANAESCSAMKDCQKYFDDLDAIKGTMSQSPGGIPGIISGVTPNAAQ